MTNVPVSGKLRGAVLDVFAKELGATEQPVVQLIRWC